jgi:hypothetical protein
MILIIILQTIALMWLFSMLDFSHFITIVFFVMCVFAYLTTIGVLILSYYDKF